MHTVDAPSLVDSERCVAETTVAGSDVVAHITTVNEVVAYLTR